MTTMNGLPDALYSSQQVREMDRSAIHDHGIDSYGLMQKAARFSFHTLIKNCPNVKNVVVLCGSGNNAGDGYIIAAIAKRRKIKTNVIYLSNPLELKGDAQRAYQECVAEDINCQAYAKHILSTLNLSQDTVLVDSLLGTGLNSSVRGSYAEIISEANLSPYPVLAIDLPSGLSANTGQELGIAINANWTATFIGLKLGLFTGSGRNHCGEVYYSDLDVPENIITQQSAIVKKLNINNLLHSVTHRPPNTHKGQCGHTLIVGGDTGYGGAVLMAAEAAARMGSGLVTVATQAEHCSALLTRLPEAMVKPINNLDQLSQLLDAASVVVVGPGLGKSAWSEKVLLKVLSVEKKTVLDADALNIVSEHPQWLREQRNKNNYIFTPHPGEAARLLNINTSELQSDRLKAILDLREKWGGNFLLKGSGSLVTSDNEVFLCPNGNPGMASGGMGDVLSGMIGGLIAQGFDLKLALQLGTSLHACAADDAVSLAGERGLLATDLIPYARKRLNKVRKA